MPAHESAISTNAGSPSCVKSPDAATRTNIPLNGVVGESTDQAKSVPAGKAAAVPAVSTVPPTEKVTPASASGPFVLNPCMFVGFVFWMEVLPSPHEPAPALFASTLDANVVNRTTATFNICIMAMGKKSLRRVFDILVVVQTLTKSSIEMNDDAFMWYFRKETPRPWYYRYTKKFHPPSNL